jgi:hypothetical protein
MTKYYNNSVNAMHLGNSSKSGGRDKMVHVTRGACGCCSYEAGVSIKEALEMVNKEIKSLQGIKKTLMQAKNKSMDVCDSCGNLTPKKDMTPYTYDEGTDYSETIEYCPKCYDDLKKRMKKKP